MGYVVDEVYSKHPEGSWIRASTADNREAKLEENILAVIRAEPVSKVDGILTLKVAEVGVVLSKTCEPREPPLET